MTGWRGQEFPTNRRVYLDNMSISLWCDIDDPETNAFGQSGHAFSSKDPDKRHFAQTQTVSVHTGNSYGSPTYQDRQEVTEELDMCGYHWRKSNPFLAKNKPEIPAPPTLQDLEETNSEWQAGYDAATDHYLSGKPHP